MRGGARARVPAGQPGSAADVGSELAGWWAGLRRAVRSGAVLHELWVDGRGAPRGGDGVRAPRASVCPVAQ